MSKTKKTIVSLDMDDVERIESMLSGYPEMGMAGSPGKELRRVEKRLIKGEGTATMTCEELDILIEVLEGEAEGSGEQEDLDVVSRLRLTRIADKIRISPSPEDPEPPRDPDPHPRERQAMQPSPGPWELITERFEASIVAADGFKVLVFDIGEDFIGGDRTPAELELANAHLAAQAPNLLKVMKAFVKLRKGDLGCDLAPLERAIRKAERCPRRKT